MDGVSFDRAKFNFTTIACEVGYEFGEVPYTPATVKEYKISSEADLMTLASLANSASFNDYQDCVFTLTSDIEITSTDTWVPIGYGNDAVMGKLYFAGTFDGAGYTISGFNVESSSTHISAGLFGYVEGSETVIKNLIIENSTSTTTALGHHAGILAGTVADGATILNCGVSSDCTATSNYRGAIGGLAGYMSASYIYNSYNQGTVTGENNTDGSFNIGGLVGNVWNSNGNNTIKNCYNTGSVTATGSGTNNIGDLIGQIKATDAYSDLYYLSSNGNSAFGGSTTASNATNIVGKTSSEMQVLANTLNSNSITDAATWTDVTGDYPIFNFTTAE